MKPSLKIILLTILIALTTISCSRRNASPLTEKIRRFVPVKITANVSKLPDNEKLVLRKLIEAAGYMDSIYLRQVWSGNIELLTELSKDQTTEGQERLHYFHINMSPWSGLDDNAPFIKGVPDKPGGANYYPEDMTKEEFSAWAAGLNDETMKKCATGFFHTIRRESEKKLIAVPYSDEYKTFLNPAANLLRDAASLTENPSLKKFLETRADAFLSNNYYESDVAWMELDSQLEPTIGPYEVYMDELFNYKAAFEAFITLRNDEETKKLEKFSSYLQEIENNLPIDSRYRNPKIGESAPIRVVDVIVTGGESRAGVQTAAFNLPNDEKVTAEKGSKRVMLKNVMEAKFNMVLIPIARKAINDNLFEHISFDPFFTHILAHELMHGLGPQNITVDGKRTTVRESLKEVHSAFEEAKADISGLFLLQYLIDKGEFEKSYEEQMYVTYLAGAFRSVRFGINESHGKGMALQFNYLLDEGAFIFDKQTAKFSIHTEKMREAVKKLTGEIMTIQAEGNYKKAKELIGRYATIRPEMQIILNTLTDIPTDIEPLYTSAK
jgi:hypothetical protein